jgi:hypothetical protein
VKPHFLESSLYPWAMDGQGRHEVKTIMQRTGTLAIPDEADARMTAHLPIVPRLDLPRTLKLGDYHAAVAITRDCLGRLESLMVQQDAARRDLNAAKEHIEDCKRRVLQAAEIQFGPDSEDFKTAGGTPPMPRQRSVREANEPGIPHPKPRRRPDASPGPFQAPFAAHPERTGTIPRVRHVHGCLASTGPRMDKLEDGSDRRAHQTTGTLPRALIPACTLRS